MPHAIRIIQGLSIIAVLLLPALALLMLPFAEPYEGRLQTEFPEPTDTALPDPAAREQFADALAERSSVRRLALQARSRLLQGVFGFVDQNDVVSGTDGFLFLRSSLTKWGCEEHEALRYGWDRFETIAEVADASRVPVTFVVVPNKATVVPYALEGRAGLYRECYQQFERELQRRLARLNSPRVIHQKSVLANPVQPLTYKFTDSHWNSLGRTLALQQLLSHFSVETAVQDAGEDLLVETGMRRMIQDDRKEPDRRFRLVGSGTVDADALLIFDSFYQELSGQLPKWFTDITAIHYRQLDDADFSRAERLVITSVERAFLERAVNSWGVGWGSGSTQWILDKAERATEDCVWQEGLQHRIANGYALLNAPAGRSRVCISLTFNKPLTSRLYLPDADGAFPTSSALWQENADRLALILPARYAGKTLKLEFGVGSRVDSVRFGWARED